MRELFIGTGELWGAYRTWTELRDCIDDLERAIGYLENLERAMGMSIEP